MKVITVASRFFDNSELHNVIRTLHASGHCDQEIADAWNESQPRQASRKLISKARRLLMLSSNGKHARHCSRVAKRTKLQCYHSGAKSLGEVRSIVFRTRAASQGWPPGIRQIGVRLLNALHSAGPLTRRQLANYCGVQWRGKQTFHSNDPEGSYTANLLARGLIRIVCRLSIGRSRFAVYALAKDIAPFSHLQDYRGRYESV